MQVRCGGFRGGKTLAIIIRACHHGGIILTGSEARAQQIRDMAKRLHIRSTSVVVSNPAYPLGYSLYSILVDDLPMLRKSDGKVLQKQWEVVDMVIRDEVKFCAVCGAPYVEAACPNCGSRGYQGGQKCLTK